MKVTLFTPDGKTLAYTEAKIDSNLIPDLSFTGVTADGKLVRVTTTLAYLVEMEIEPNA